MRAVEGWQIRKVKELFESSIPGDWGNEGTPEDGVPVLRSTNFRNNGSINFMDVVFRKIDKSRLERRKINTGSILIEKSGGSPTQAAGRVVYCDCDFGGTASNFIEILEVKRGLSSKYIAFLLLYLYQSGLVLKYQQQTTGIINFKLGQYVEEPVTLPIAKDEQAQIAAILSTLDRAIEQTEAIIAKQQRIKAGLMQDLLTKGIDENGVIRSETTHKFKDSPLGRIPVEWEIERLENVANLVTSGSRGWARFYSNEGAVFLRIGNLTREHINFRFDDVVYVNVPESSEGKRTAVQEGDLLISITADLGIIAVVPEEFPESYVNQHIALVRLDKEVVAPRFIGHLLNGFIGQMQIDKLNESGAKAGLNLPTIKNLLVFKPAHSEQKKIVDFLDSIDTQIAGDKMRTDKLRHQKAGLMHDLLTGTVRVKSHGECKDEKPNH